VEGRDGGLLVAGCGLEERKAAFQPTTTTRNNHSTLRNQNFSSFPRIHQNPRLRRSVIIAYGLT